MKTIVKISVALMCLFCALSILVSCDGMSPEEIIGGIIGDETINPIDPPIDDECPHLYGDWAVVKDGYCESRKFQRTCRICGEVDRREGTDEDHWWSEWETQKPTCIEGGFDGRICDLCGKAERKDETMPTGDHTFGWMQITSSMHESYCKVCHRLFNSAEHTYGLNDKCTVCDYAKPLKTFNITMWVSERDGMTQLYMEQALRFAAQYPEININFSISGVTEADAASQVLIDPFSAPDIYCFSQDMAARLIQANLLSPVPVATVEDIIARNDKSSIKAASAEGIVYAYPLASDNGYYMYYDKSVITNPDSLEQMIADCEAAGKKFRVNLQNAWYLSSFFFATGCESTWITDEDGYFIDVIDSFNSPEGLVAMKGMKKLIDSECYEEDNDTIDKNTAVIVTGLWNDLNVRNELGENIAAADLPSFVVDGNSYHMGSFSGGKLMGVKPQTDVEKQILLHELADYLSSEECQLERIDYFSFAPSNLNAQQSEIAQQNMGIAALAEQSAYAVPQGNIHGSWWDIALGLGVLAEAATSEDDLQAALDHYDQLLGALLKSTVNPPDFWALIGIINDSYWDYDYVMTDMGDGVWQSEVVHFEANAEFKLRKNESWDSQVGVAAPYTGETDTGYLYKSNVYAAEPANIVVETAGDYVVILELNEETGWARVTLIPA